jgi:hypothetical protein
MHPAPEKIAANWISYAQEDPNSVPNRVFERGWLIYDLARLHPSLAWDAIKCVVGRYREEDLFTEVATQAQRVLGNTAAGPLEDLLAKHGAAFIDAVELEARGDRRFFWTLGCVWQNSMTDEIWMRVQKAAGKASR